MKKAPTLLLLALIVNSGYLKAFATPSIFYMANVLAHIALGVALIVAVAFWWRARMLAVAAMLPATLLGGFLVSRGALREHAWALSAHEISGVVAVIVLVLTSDRWRRELRIAAVAAAALPLVVGAYTRVRPDPRHRIVNPKVVPIAMTEEGGGPQSPFWPSSARTNVGGVIPSDFFMDSKLCGECHRDIYEQWNSSVHHFASFNNQFYRKSVEHMQELSGTQGSKWCAGCHDHAVFFNGRFEKPIKDQIDTPEAHTGLGCVSCHSIVHVDSTMGNGGFTIEYPPLHNLLTSRNRAVRWLDRFLTFTEPEPHRRTFMKPFMRLDSAEFCSTCHKVHLDVPVNNYRWMRGFNDYDAWQASGVSGQGARSFYYPAQSMNCVDCHMPLVPSRDPGHHDGKVHSHRFPAANMAVAYANRDHEQMRVTEEFLKSGFITVDIFAASPAEEIPRETPMLRRTGEAPRMMTAFATGEESEQAGAYFIREVGKLAAPIDRAATRFRPGSTVRVDVVVRTRKIGHFFPAGTVDSFDIWLELIARDASGRPIFWSGRVEDDGRGPVEKGAHFYRSYLLDAAGNPIDKRNAWQARSLLYVRLIPPGAADVAHFRVQLPPDVKGPVTLEAKLNYRKFMHFYTQYVYAGKAGAGEADKHHDSRAYSFEKTNIPKNVSGRIKDEIPDLPIVTLARAEAHLETGDARLEPAWEPVIRKEDRERWNDWGIGLLLQGDLKGAEYAFRRVTEAEPGYADGWLNVARALIQEGQTDAAKPYLAKARELGPNLGRVHFFRALVEKADGDYDAALASLRQVEAQYPRDRVVLNQIGRILFLKRQYREAVAALEKVLAVDPEDLQAHYTLMLAYRGLGDNGKAAREETLFRRFKADESSQALTERPRLLSPEDNNERQMIHEHDSVPLHERPRPRPRPAPAVSASGIAP
jgi:Flp pilus assembly protein TadD